MTSIVCPMIHAGIFPQHNPQIVYYADQAFMLSANSDIWYPVVGECCSLPVQMKARHRVEVAFHIHLLIDPFLFSSSVHRLKALEEQANGDPQLLSYQFSLPLFLSSSSSSSSSFYILLFTESRRWVQRRKVPPCPRRSPLHLIAIAVPPPNMTADRWVCAWFVINKLTIWQLMSYIYGSITLVCTM